MIATVIIMKLSLIYSEIFLQQASQQALPITINVSVSFFVFTTINLLYSLFDISQGLTFAISMVVLPSSVSHFKVTLHKMSEAVKYIFAAGNSTTL